MSMSTPVPSLIPELYVSDLDRSLTIYVEVLGFRCHVTRPEDRFVYLIRDDVHVMLEEAHGPGRKFGTAPLERPFGRGMNFQIRVDNVDALYARAVQVEVEIIVPIEERWYRQSSFEVGNRQFVMADPDGYLLRFFADLGQRPA
jgi:catechol 2,3-dioxygenase-like lactoylglutathione lyase family enzyme